MCLPARNEEATVGHIVATVRRTLVEHAPWSTRSSSSTTAPPTPPPRPRAGRAPACSRSTTILPDLPAGTGKGNALWKSLYVCDGDIVCWLDADICNFGSHFVTRLLEPLLTDPAIGFVKGYYRRPLHGEPTGGGRVTELMARPVISALFPHLAGFVQPLAGEYAGRRALLEAVPFVEGWGVEIGLLIDLAARFGIDALAQADLGVREHRNRPLDELGPQAMAVLLTGLRRAGVPVEKRLAELVRYDDDQHVERVAVEIRERPPMVTIPAYRAKFGRELTA